MHYRELGDFQNAVREEKRENKVTEMDHINELGGRGVWDGLQEIGGGDTESVARYYSAGLLLA